MPAHQWFLMQEFQRASYFNWIIQMRCASVGLTEELGTADSLTVHHEGTLELHFNQAQWRQMGEKALAKFINDYHWLEQAVAEVYKRTDDFLKFLNKLRHEDVAVATGEQLVDWLNKFEWHRNHIHVYGVIGTILEFDHELFTKYLQNYVNEQIKITGSSLSVNKVFSELTIFHQDTFVRQEEKSLLGLVQIAQNRPSLAALILNSSNSEALAKLPAADSEFSALLDQHFYNYCWISYQYVGPAFDKEYFVENIRGLLHQQIDAETKIKYFDDEMARVKRQQEQVEAGLKFDDVHKKIFALARELSFTKSLRNDAYYFSFYCLEPLLKEFGRRLNLPLSRVRLFLPGEAQEALKAGRDCTDMLNDRWQYSVYAVLNGKEEMIAGEVARKLVKSIKELEPTVAEVKEFTGTVAVTGKAKGPVKLILEVTDLSKMNQGDILVSNATYPSLVPAMKKAAAIVTDLGGITSHAAIISRELGIPCIVGTKIATKILKDNDIVEVDADKGIIKKI